MPSTNKLSSRRVAKFLYTFCGIFASFGVVTKALVAGIVFLATFAIPATSLLLSSNNASAVGNSNSSNTVSATLPGSVAIRLLDSTATSEISSLDFNLTPTASGTSATQSMVVDVATSNPTGYKLYMQSDYKDSNNNYTNSLVHTTNHIPDSDIADTIPTYVPGSGSGSGTSTLYWNYINPLLNANVEDPSSKVASTIPAHGSPDKLDQYFTTTNSRQTEVSFNVSVDTTIVSGTYENELLFSAVGNPTTLSYSVTYDMDGGEPQIAKQEETAAAGSDSITIPSTIPTKSGHAFSHWQIVIPTGSTATASCNNTSTCNPGDNVVIHSGINSEGDFEGDIILKAVYDATYTYTITYNCNGGSGCPENTTYGPTTDTSYNYTIPSATITKQGYAFTNFLGSDSQSYDIGDTINLDTSSTSITLTAQYDTHDITIISNMQDMTSELCANTIIGTSTTLTDTRDNNTYTIKKLKDGNCWMTQDLQIIGLKTLTSSDSDVVSNFNLTASDSGTWCTENTSACYDKSMVIKDNTYNTTLYNWFAATAGTGTYSTDSGENASSSICPKGWRLPTGGYTGELQTLYSYYSSFGSLLNNNGPSFVLSSIRYGDNSNGPRADYWSSTATNINSARYIYITKEPYINPANSAYKYYGMTLRCLAKGMTSTLTVNPNGGTWEGSTSTQTFTQDSGTTKTITNPISPDTYTISYDGNNQGASYTGTPTSVTRAFAGWILSGGGTYAGGVFGFGAENATLTAQYDPVSNSFTLPTITKSGAVCGWMVDGVSYTSGQSGVVISSDTTFKAVCQSTTFNGITTMQQMTPTICNIASIGETATLTDTRDNNTYTVKKLNDGNCWMTQNLRLAGSKTLTPSDSDVISNFTLPTATNAYNNSNQGANEPYNAWCWTVTEEWCINRPVNYYDSSYSNYGAYYTWNAATAGTGTYSVSSGEASSSICPKGWKMPSSNSNGDFKTLYGYYNSYNEMSSSSGPNFVMSGIIGEGSSSIQSRGGVGIYWGSTATRNYAANELFFRSDLIVPDNSAYKPYGFSVRCLAKESGSLTVDPNGGTWNGSTEKQTFTQDAGTTKTISNPTIDNPETYTISYDDNGQGASYTGTPTSVDKSASWSLYGNGTYAGGTYQFGTGGGTLVAHYNNTLSDSFILPTITKSGFTCGWAEGGPDGALYDGGSSRTVQADTTYYAVCGPTVTVSTTNVSPSVNSLFIPSGRSKTVTVTPSSGYYLSNVNCPSGYTCSGYSTGSSVTTAQTITVKNDGTSSDGVLTVTGAAVVKTIANSTYMQEVEQCPSSLTTGTQYTLTDQGETSKSYTVSKLADGKCWMTSNYNRSAGALSSTYYNIGSGRSYSVPTSNCTTSSWSSDSGNYYCNNSTYGGYYSYRAATAGANPSSGASSYDICPKGWRLPTRAEYNTLISAYGAGSAGSKLVAAPVNMKYGSGCNSSGCPGSAGSSGVYWSSTTSGSSYAYYLIFSSSSANTLNYLYKRYGYSVRCVFGS